MPGDQTDPEGYELRLLRTPVTGPVRRALEELLGHKGEPWIGDIRRRLDHAAADLFAVAFHDGRPVSNVWVGRAAGRPQVGLLGHVYTREEHRRHGLSGRLLQMATAAFSAEGGRWMTLGTGSAGAGRLYRRVGFGDLLGSVAEGHATMLRPGDAEGLRREFSAPPGACAVERLGRDHYPAACLLLAVWPGGGKLPACEIDTGGEAEHRLLAALDAQEDERRRLFALAEPARGLVRGLACTAREGLEIYAPRLDSARLAAFREAADAML